MRGVSIPIHRYAAMAHGWLQRSPAVEPRVMQDLTFASRAFTRVVMRLRAQAEAEAAHYARTRAMEGTRPPFTCVPGHVAFKASSTQKSIQTTPPSWYRYTDTLPS